MKRILISLLTAALALGPVAHAEFSDVGARDEHFAAVTSLVSQGIVEGYEDGTFRGENSVTRAEALKIILMGTDVAVDSSGAAGLLFSDVAESDWFASVVGTAVTRGIVQGYDDGTFKPENVVNRAEAVKMLTLAANVKVPTAVHSFDDVDSGAWYAAYATYAKAWNLVPAQVDGLWHGEEEMTRGDIAEMVYRLQQVETSGGSFDEATNWLRTNFETVDVSMKVPFGWGTKTDGVGAAFLLDSAAGQVSLLSPFSNGGTLLMTRYANSGGESTSMIFDRVRMHANGSVSETTVGGYEALVIEPSSGSTYREWYIRLPSGAVVNLLALRGDGAYSSYLEWYFNAMVDSLEYEASSGDLTLDEALTTIRQAIDVDGQGKAAMALLDDWKLFETDSIGVGTGPVDYYYSTSADVTVKYERSFDVLLDIRDGETSAF